MKADRMLSWLLALALCAGCAATADSRRKTPPDTDGRESEASPPRLLTFADEADHCRLEIVRPEAPPRSLLTFRWAAKCSDISTVVIRGDKLLVSGSLFTSYDLVAGTERALGPLPGEAVRSGFDRHGNPMALVELGTQDFEGEASSEAWPGWEGQRQALSDPDRCDWVLWRSYRHTGASWSTVKTEFVEGCARNGEERVEEDPGGWGLDSSPAWVWPRDPFLGEDWLLYLPEERLSGKRMPQLDALVSGSEFWDEDDDVVLLTGEPPRMATGMVAAGWAGSWSRSGQLLWERDGGWEVIPGSSGRDGIGAAGDRQGQFLVLCNSDNSRIRAFDLSTHRLIWEGSGPLCPVWIP